MASIEKGIVKTSGGIVGAGAGGGLGLNAPGAGPKVQSFAGGAATNSVAVSEEVGAVWADIVAEAKPTTWIVCEYDAAGKKVEVKASGTGGLSEFKAALGDNLAWGGFKCIAVDNRENTTSKRSKYVFVQYMPATAPGIRKAKMGSHKGTLKAICTGAHLDVSIDAKEELTEEDLVKRLQAATGAHKPNGYEFEPGVVTSALGFLNG
jgi:hypothetical protein